MAAVAPDVRARFETGRKAAFNTARLTQGLGGVEAAGGAPQRVTYLFAVALLFDLISMIAAKWADDPPRDDFDSTTRARPRLLTKAWEREDMSDPLVQRLLTLAYRLDDSDRYLRAGLRAFERMQGAQRRGSELVSARAAEARGYVRYAAPTVMEVGDGIHNVNELLEREPDRWFGADSPEGSRPLLPASRAVRIPAQLPDATLASLYLLGIRRGELTETMAQTPAADWNPKTTREDAGAFQQLGEQLKTWEPLSSSGNG